MSATQGRKKKPLYPQKYRGSPKVRRLEAAGLDVEEEVGLQRPVDTGSPRCGINGTRRPYPLNIGLRVTDFAQRKRRLANRRFADFCIF